jgi:hypothetical protein
MKKNQQQQKNVDIQNLDNKMASQNKALTKYLLK